MSPAVGFILRLNSWVFASTQCKSVVERWKQGKKASLPHFTSPRVVYDHRTATFHDEYVSLATTDGTSKPTTCYQMTGGTRPTRSISFRMTTRRQGQSYTTGTATGCFTSTARNVEPDTPEQATIKNGTVLGVDLGVNNLAVTSTGTFWTGDEFDHWRREYEQRRGNLQECGTRWAHENIQAVGQKEVGRFKQTLHRISNELLAEARRHGRSVVAFENLTDIRERTGASWGHKWAFNRLYEYVEYKATEYGIAVQQVDPANTSRRCSTCGFTHPDNRETESFECLKCGYENHADYNAAKNIGLRYLRRNQTGDGGGAPAGVRLNSGTVNVNGESSPVDVSAGTGVHAESPRY